ncbi:Fur family transcriptional regulator [Corynebacterium aquilae]|uniref:Sugar ABC transporter substrate-binding protein n=1 Tax=Corynebacterium aquilae DSM 44791 TaxID=1431546 RepID=A0A1L7CH62_9CORY|nr:transcriptional repressor [Corynebacterium aquilae]APT85187.1 sugar ABC transporter substrate-binding protein [Corynebacterium aquilae DSM 44791]
MAVKTDASIPKLGARSTRQRAAVVNVLRELTNFSSAKTIHQEITARNYKVGLTTVYRTLQSLADINAVDVLHMSTGETLYRACESNDHHHHIVCSNCGKTVEIDGGPVEEWAANMAKANGFVLTGHTAEVFGTCSSCQHA